MKNWILILFDGEGEIMAHQELPATTTLNEVNNLIENSGCTEWECYPVNTE